MMDEKEGRSLVKAFAALPQAATSSQPCPPPALIWETLRLEAPEADRKRVVEHISNCGSCAAAWRLAREITRSAPQPGFLASRRGAVRRAGWMALATAAVLLVGISVLQLARIEEGGQNSPMPLQQLPKIAADRSGTGPGYREGDGASIFSSLDPGEALPRDHCLLQWRVEPEAAGVQYQIEVLDEGLEPIVSNGRLSESEFLVPAEKLTRFPPGSRIVWHLKAEWPDGQKRSATFSSSLK